MRLALRASETGRSGPVSDAEAVRVRMLSAVIRAELRRAGVRPERVGRLLKLVDLDALDVNDDGVLSGLAEEIAKLRTDFPEGFAAAETKPAERKKPASKAAEEDRRTATERQAAAMLGGGGGVGGGAVGQAAYLLRASGRAEEAAQLLRRHGRGGPPEAA